MRGGGVAVGTMATIVRRQRAGASAAGPAYRPVQRVKDNDQVLHWEVGGESGSEQ